MSSLWLNNDRVFDTRLNRHFMKSVLISPTYDIDDNKVVTVTTLPIVGDDIVGTETVHYTFSSTADIAFVHAISVTNRDTVANHASVHLVPLGGSRLTANCIFAGTLQASQSVRIRGCWRTTASSTIRSISTTGGIAADDVILQATVLDFTDTVAGINVPAPVHHLMSSSVNTDVYTCPASGVTMAHVWFSLVNVNASSIVAAVRVKPNGVSSDLAIQVIVRPTMISGETIQFGGPDDPIVLRPGDRINTVAGVASSIGMVLTAIEYLNTP